MPTVDKVRQDRRGQLWLDTKDHNNQAVTKCLGNATYIEEITKVIETNVKFLVLTFLYGDKWEKISIPRSHLQDKELLQYADYGLNINRKNANHVAEDIQRQEKKHTVRLVHEGIGHGTIADDDTGEIVHIFKHNKCLGADSSYVGGFDIKPKGGKIECFREFLKENIYNTPLELAVVVGLAGVLIGYLYKEVQCPNIVTSVYGDSSKGKSTFAVFAVSMGSNPDEYIPSPLFRDFYGTDNSLLNYVVDNNGYCICYDEANKYQGKCISTFIYNLEGGTQKQRLTREAKNQKRGSYHTSIITTSEKQIVGVKSQNAGEATRALEFGNIPWTRNAPHSEQVKEFALNNYGRPIIHLANKVLKMGKAKVIKRFKANRESYLSKSKTNDAFTHRMSIKYAILLTTLQLANECMKLELSYDLVMDMLVESEYATSGKRDIRLKAYEYLVQTFNTNPDKFSIAFNKNVILSAERETWGIQVPQRKIVTSTAGNYRTIIYFSENKFRWLLEKENFEGIDVVLKRLKESGYLHCQKDGKYYHERKINSTGSQTKVYGIIIYDAPDVDSEAELKLQLRQLERLKARYCGEKL